jgi:hypothetical protein
MVPVLLAGKPRPVSLCHAVVPGLSEFRCAGTHERLVLQVLLPLERTAADIKRIETQAAQKANFGRI